MNVVPFELYSDCHFYCPATGQKLIGGDPFKPSAATLFAYIDEIADFEFITDELREQFDAMDTDDSELDQDRFQAFLNSINDQDAVCFQITQCGMACGPVSITVHIGIRMNHESVEQEIG